MANIFPMVLTGGMAIKRLANVASNVCGCRLADVLAAVAKPRPDEWQVYMLDVGQGLAMVIARNGKAILYDTGLAWPEGDSGQQLIIPWLHWHNLEPEGVILSHEHLDHREAGLNIAHMADVMDPKSVKLGTSSALCAWRSVAMARIAFQRALAFTR